jgi:hypothetical protein
LILCIGKNIKRQQEGDDSNIFNGDYLLPLNGSWRFA